MDPDLLQRLRAPEVFPNASGADSVQIIQTHLSVVCLVGDRVYKLRKPVELPFVDFRDPAAREHDCREELRLNRRLCPEVYLDVVALRRDGERIRFDGDDGCRDGDTSNAIDHAVLMTRLPEERMLDRLLAEDRVEVAAIEAIAERMAAFHRDHCIEPGKGAPGHPSDLRSYVLANFDDTEADRDRLFDRSLHEALRSRATTDLRTLIPELERRIAEGRCVDGHGDLHARNICLVDPPAIYDCLEFSDSMRCGDTATENAFLCMDLRERGHPELAEAYLERYVECSGDEAQRRLLPPLVQYRAMVRAKVAAIASHDEDVDQDERERQAREARAYLQLAAAVAVEQDGPVHLLACGLPASGKSFVFEHLARRTSWLHLSTDGIRKQVFSVPDGQKAPDEAYTAEGVERIYREMIRRAAEHTRSTGGSVLLDATFQQRDERRSALASARELGTPALIVHVEVDEAEALRRLEARDASSLSDARTEVYESMKASFERPGDDEPALRIDGAESVERSIDRILVALLATRAGTTD